MPSRSFKATLAMVPVLGVAACTLWLMYAPKGYGYDFEVVSRATLDAQPQPEQHWVGMGGERSGGALFFKADESAIMTEKAGVMPLLADTTAWVREHSTFREHPRIEVIAENVDVHGYSTQQRLITSDDTLFVSGDRESADVSVDGDDDAIATAVSVAGGRGETVTVSTDTAREVVVKVGGTTVSRATRASRAARSARDARSRSQRRFVRATHTETYVWTTEDVDDRMGRAFERFADSLVMLASHRSVRAIRDKHRGQSEGPYRGVALRVVSTAVTIDSLGRRREVVTRAEMRGLNRDRKAVARVHRRKLEAVDRQLSHGDVPPTPHAPPAPVAPPAPAAIAVTRP